MAFHDPYTPVRDTGASDEIPGWTERPQPVRTRPAPKPFRFLLDMAKGVAALLLFTTIWTVLALFIDAAQGGM